MSSSESLEMEPLTEKHRSKNHSFSEDDDSEDDIIVHGGDDGPSTEDRQLLNEEDEREKLLTKRRKVLIGSKKDRRQGNHARKKSIESYMEDGTLTPSTQRRSKIKRRRWSAKRILCCHALVFSLVLLVIAVTLLVRGLSRPIARPKQNYKGLKVSNGTNEFRSTVLIISLDGFRPDYIDRDVTPNMHALREKGVAPEFMRPSFPSVTFPNHYTLVTGLYPESHGIVGNHFWDPVLMDEFNVGKPKSLLPSKWWEGTGGFVEPIWVTAENQGVISAIHMWPGSESVIHGVQATHVDKFNQYEILPNKVDRVLSWLDMDDEERPSFIATYVPTIDTVGHHYGPDSPQMNTSLADVDDMIGSIISGFEQRNLTDIVNLIIVSDHGMATTSNSRIIYLDSLLDLNLIEHFDCWPLKGLRPVSAENTTAIYEHLKSLSVDQPWNVYARDIDMPPHWHFHASYRIAPIFMVPDPGWVIVNNLREFDPEEVGEYQPKGIHGYDNDNELMRSLFLASGPAFKHSYPVAPFNNTEVYGIMTSILGITGNPNNGTFVKGRLPKLESSEEVAVIPSSTEIGNTGIIPPYVSSAIAVAESSANAITTAATATAVATTTAGTLAAATTSVLPDMTEADWEQIEEDLAEAAEEGRPLTWKEYLELKAEAMREELDEWWEWMKHGGSSSAK